MNCTSWDTFTAISSPKCAIVVSNIGTASLTPCLWQNFLVDASGHVKLTDFGLATGALNPQKIESMKHKVCMGVNMGKNLL